MDPLDILKKYEKIVYLILIFLFAVIVAFSIGELVILLFAALFVNTPGLLVDNEILGIIGYFLLVLIGVELLATISVFIKDNVIHVETVIIVAIIAIARGVILFEPSSPGANALNMFGTAAIIIALCSGYYLLKKGGIRN
jgi:uncharacterized membrane protein (DUF373 family)